MKNISGVIIAKNEANVISRAIDQLGFTEEIVVIDDQSTDGTAKVAEAGGARVIPHGLEGDFADLRNFSMTQTKNDWVLFLDADEVITPELRQEIMGLRESSNASCYRVRRMDFFWGRKLEHGESGHTLVPRLVHRHRGRFQREVHEEWHGHKGCRTLRSSLLHYPHPTVREFLAKINHYSTLNARHFQKSGRRTNVLDIAFTPALKFIYTYLIKAGFRDGAAGFVYSFMMSFHSFLTRSKLFLLDDKK